MTLFTHFSISLQVVTSSLLFLVKFKNAIIACFRENVCIGVIPVSYTGIPRLIVLCFIALHRYCMFYRIEDKTFYQQKRLRLALSQWFITKPAISLRYVCIIIIFHPSFFFMTIKGPNDSFFNKYLSSPIMNQALF